MNIIVDNNERIAKEIEVRNSWEEIRPERSKLVKILTGEKELEEDDNRDTVLIYQCASLILANLSIYEDDLKGASDQIKEIPIEEKIKKHFGSEIAPYVSCLFIIDNPESSVTERLDALKKLRLTTWKAILEEKTALIELIKNFPDFIDENEKILFLKCISMVVLELDLKEKEVEVLEDLKFI